MIHNQTKTREVAIQMNSVTIEIMELADQNYKTGSFANSNL